MDSGYIDFEGGSPCSPILGKYLCTQFINLPQYTYYCIFSVISILRKSLAEL